MVAEDIAEMVQRIAAEVARGGTRTQRDDFIADALAEVCGPRANAPARIVGFNSTKGTFEPWVAATLRNLWTSRLRPGRRRPMAMSPDAVDGYAAPLLPWVRIADHLGTPFSPSDQDRINGWKPCVRVELLVLSGLFVKLSADDWERYVAAAERVYQKILPLPFPPPDILAPQRHEPGDRIAPLAAAIGMIPNTLSQRWKRKQPLLESLDFIRGLRGSTDRSGQP